MGYKFITFPPKQTVLKMVCNLSLFCLATVLATFQKIGRFFSKSSVHPAEEQERGQRQLRDESDYSERLSTQVIVKASSSFNGKEERERERERW